MVSTSEDIEQVETVGAIGRLGGPIKEIYAAIEEKLAPPRTGLTFLEMMCFGVIIVCLIFAPAMFAIPGLVAAFLLVLHYPRSRR